jgi:hypothetical protein
MSMPWELKHSVIADAHRQTVWEFVSNIDNLARVEGDAVEATAGHGQTVTTDLSRRVTVAQVLASPEQLGHPTGKTERSAGVRPTPRRSAISSSRPRPDRPPFGIGCCSMKAKSAAGR